MKQLYAAGPLTANRGPNVRAATAGIGADELQAALSFSNYAPPPGQSVETTPLPVRLALLSTTAGRVLTHITPNGGTYFAHALLDVPATADAQLAIQTWGSPLWQRHEPETAADLPDLPYLPVAELLDDAALRDWLGVPARRELLEFVLTALLGTPATTRIFVAAAAEDVARVVFAVTRALPPGLLEEFTFSTYEPDPLACHARLVGHDTGSADWELPSACYGDGSVGFNPSTGRRSELGADVPFATFAAGALATGEVAPLDEVKATWQRLGLRDARQFDLVYRLARGTGTLTKGEAAEALQHPSLASWVSTRMDALKQFLEWALDDREFATASFSRAVQALRQKPEVVAKLALVVREHGLRALKSGDRARLANALEVVLPMAAPAKANAVWGELLGHLPVPSAVAWDVRWYLLPRFVRFKQQQSSAGVDAGLTAWLDVPAERLGELLAVELPKSYHVSAARTCLGRDGEPSAELTRTLAAHPALTLTLLKPGDEGADRSVALFERLLDEAPTHPWFEELLERAAEYPAALLNRFFESALAAGKVDADRVVRTQGPRLLELFAGQSVLDRLGTAFLATPPDDVLRNDGVLAFLGRLRDDAAVGDELKGRIAALQAVRRYLDKVTFDAGEMAAAAAAFGVTPTVLPASVKGEVFDAVSAELLQRADEITLQADLELSLVHFGGVLANDPADLFENVLRDLRGRTDIGREPGLVKAFLAVALGAADSPELAGKLDGLDGHAFAVASDAAKRGGNRLLGELDDYAATWPKEARAKWGFLLAAVRPQRRFKRDCAFLLVGAILATAAWWAVKLFA